ncbi:hypothetical protein AALA22_08875 [Anaerovoracaceae bacterium 41-7]
MPTSYMTVYNRFLDKITDYFVFELSDEDTCNYCHRLMLSALANISSFNHELEIDEEAKCFTEELDNREIEYIACRMACEWVDPQINNTTLTRQYIGTKDEKFFAPSNLLKELKNLREDWVARTRKIRRDYTYENSDYFNT